MKPVAALGQLRTSFWLITHQTRPVRFPRSPIWSMTNYARIDQPHTHLHESACEKLHAKNASHHHRSSAWPSHNLHLYNYLTYCAHIRLHIACSFSSLITHIRRPHEILHILSITYALYTDPISPCTSTPSIKLFCSTPPKSLVSSRSYGDDLPRQHTSGKMLLNDGA